MKKWGISAIWLVLSLAWAWNAEAQAPRLVRSLSGPSGKVVGGDFVLDEVRTRFVYPADRSLAVYFEWESPAGDHELVATWIRPDGQVASISAPVKIQTSSTELKSYWLFDIVPALSNGVWTVTVRIDGQPAGSHAFEIAGANARGGRMTLDDVFRINRLDDAGHRVDSSNGFVVGPNAVATAFQSIDAASGLEVEFADGRRVTTADILAVSRLGDWAVVKADTKDIKALPRADDKSISIGSRLVTFGNQSGTSVMVPVDVGAVSAQAGQAPRVRFSPVVEADALGGPLIDEYGKVVGILGGSMTPGLRIGRKTVAANPGLAAMLAGSTTATVISDVPATLSSPARTLAELARDGVLTTPITPMPEFVYGGTALQLPNTTTGRISDTTEFSTRDDAVINVYTFWVKRANLSKGELSFTVFDATNKVRSAIPPKKVTLQTQQQRIAVTWPPKGMPPGFYRIDVSWDGKPVWRTYIRVTD